MATIDQLYKKAAEYITDLPKKRLYKAYEFAKRAHGDQKRKSGEDYISHPLETALILSELHADEASLVTALLHDVPEDTAVSLHEIEKIFGKEVAFLINGITKLSKVYFRNDMETRQIESLKRLLLYSAKDVRVILIKLSDRLHNMMTLEAHNNITKQLRIARETLEIYVPIANLFGITILKEALEDLCFQHLFKNRFETLSAQIQEKHQHLDSILEESLKRFKKMLEEEKVGCEIKGGFSRIYEIFKKMEANNKTVPDAEDLIRIQIITETRDECYRVMGLIHQLFKPKLGAVKDYIAVPKPNGYQGLHTLVFGIQGVPIGLQIRTKEMDLKARYGFAAAFFMNNCAKKGQGKLSFQEMNWAKQILLLQQEMKDNANFMDNLRGEICGDRIFTFTPRGDLIDLPRGATCLDFAYAIHTQLGHSSEYAILNNRKVPLATAPKTGDTIKIVSIPEQKFPKREWLNFARTQLARNKIKDMLKKETKENRVNLGKMFLEQELKKTSKNFYEVFNTKNITTLLKEFKFESFGDFLQAVGEGSLDPKMILDTIYARKFHSYEEILGRAFKQDKSGRYKVDIRIKAKDQVGLLKNIVQPISDSGINIMRSYTVTSIVDETAVVNLTLMIKNFEELSRLYEHLCAVDGVESVSRVQPRSKLIWLPFLIAVGITVWSSLPYGIHLSLLLFENQGWLLYIVSLLGHLLVLISVCYIYQYLRTHYANWSDKTFLRWIMPSLVIGSSLVIILELRLYEITFALAAFFGLLNLILSGLGIYFFATRFGFPDRLIKN